MTRRGMKEHTLCNFSHRHIMSYDTKEFRPCSMKQEPLHVAIASTQAII
jgi:hypothetical protein